MSMILTDAEIQDLLTERKPLPPEYREKLQVKPKRGHKERELEILGVNGSEFVLILRQSEFNALMIENVTIYDFHIHTATELYQQQGMREDSFAEPTARYANIHGAIRCCLTDCVFNIPADEQPSLFEEEE